MIVNLSSSASVRKTFKENRCNYFSYSSVVLDVLVPSSFHICQLAIVHVALSSTLFRTQHHRAPKRVGVTVREAVHLSLKVPSDIRPRHAHHRGVYFSLGMLLAQCRLSNIALFRSDRFFACRQCVSVIDHASAKSLYDTSFTRAIWLHALSLPFSVNIHISPFASLRIQWTATFALSLQSHFRSSTERFPLQLKILIFSSFSLSLRKIPHLGLYLSTSVFSGYCSLDFGGIFIDFRRTFVHIRRRSS